MDKIKAVIVEDSRLARNELKLLLANFPEIELVGEAENVDSGVSLIRKVKPEILFLDINMPEKDGFDLLEELIEAPITIFTTAYDEYAIKSFEYNALDYLLKPINSMRFEQAVEKAKSKLSLIQENHQPSSDEKLVETSQLFIKDGEKCWMIQLNTISLFEINGNYTQVHFEGNKPLIYRSLNQIESKLPETHFFRANRQQIINLGHIKSVVPWFNGKLKLTLNNGSEVEISRRQSSDFKNRLSL